MRESWKIIRDPPNLESAFVSNTGKVKYLNTRGCFKTTTGSRQNGGYLQVLLQTTSGKKKKFCVHILVAKQWLIKKSSKFVVVHHKNGLRNCNNINNLTWTTQQLNCSLRRNSSLCIEYKGRFYSKFIFDGSVVKSKQSFSSAGEAREYSLTLRRNMYDAAYETLIEEEKTNGGTFQPDSSSSDHEGCI